jgi:hypothetical protein
MIIPSKHTKQWLATLMIFVFVIVLFGFFIVARTVRAQQGLVTTEVAGTEAKITCHGAPGPPCPGEAIKELSGILSDKIIKPVFNVAIVQGLLNISQFVVNRLAYEAALFVANGGPAQGSLFYKESVSDGFAKFGLEIAGEAVAVSSETLTELLGAKYDFCAPPPSVTFGLQIGIAQKYKPPTPRCDILEVTANWGSFVSDIYDTATDSDIAHKAILSKFAESLQPGRNELSAAAKFTFGVTGAVHEKQLLETQERLASDFKPVQNSVTKDIETPKSILELDFLDKIKKAVTGETTQLKASDMGSFGDAMGGLALTAASTFTNTLLSQLFNKIYDGLFASTPDGEDLFNVEAVAETVQSPEVLSKIFAATPVSTSDYNAITEFVVCPPQGIANRGLNNCVMDSNFLSVISRGNSGAPLTVREAIDEGLLNGDWPLISPEDLASNQDPLCYTYGFCYSNLVKLRKARVIPIGWELAALRNPKSNPKTLSEIISDFNTCNQYGTIDGEHPFCHLIDPNWVLKYPDTQCRATVNGEIRLTQLSPGRQSACADAPSCLGEDSKGKCVSGYGYCVREKNVWRFRGDECPAQYAGCLSMKNTNPNNGKQSAFLINTVDFSVCGQANAGCQWYRTNKYVSNKGTVADTTDDSYDWLLPNAIYDTTMRDKVWKFQTADGEVSEKEINSEGSQQYSAYSYEDRVYFTRAVQACSENEAGCSELIAAKEATLNMLRNPSFEEEENKDGIPDSWFLEGIQADQVTMEANKPAARGIKSVGISGSGGKGLVQFFPVLPRQAYTLSYFVVNDGNPTSAHTRMSFFNEKGQALSLTGLSISSDCLVTDKKILETSPQADSDWKRVSCSFVVPENAKTGKLLIDAAVSVRYDGIQLEPNEVMTDFAMGFSSQGDQTQYMKIAPDYLNCTGAVTDSSACVSYAQMCQAQDVGCNRYTPEDGDPYVPAITSPLDSCPAECVGYATYKQEVTRYDDEDFPVYFIPAKATACSAQFIGCDGFTNLSFAEAGGENVEYYTNLRACVTQAMANGSANNKQSATFFTWEGSDNAGYQLRSWVLLQSNLNNAPCTKWDVSDKDELVCAEDAAHQALIAANTTCDAHDDIILNNPDCREFFDVTGKIHYREFPDTVTVSDQCAPYRKDISTKGDCDVSGGYWDAEVDFCRYFGLASESNSCPAAANGCRSYTGGAGRNSVTLLNEKFESGSFQGFRSWPNQNSASLFMSNESVATGGHSLGVTATKNQKAGFSTIHAYLNNQNSKTTYDTTNDTTKTETCSAFDNATVGHTISPAGCEIDLGKNGTVDCVIGKGEHSCGTLVNKLVNGKTLVFEFWAKGSGKLYAGLEKNEGADDEHDLVDTSNENINDDSFKPLQLSGSWRVYSLGPFDSSKFNDVDKDSILFFFTNAGDNFFIDNLVVKQVEENITIVKDSWVVPSTCDSAPNGVSAPQYYLGCEAYSDQNGKDHTLYQFSRLCSEKVVGCERLYQTFESKSVYEQAFNVRCAKSTNNNLGNPSIVNKAVACEVNGKEYCTIAAGRSFCTFNQDGTFGEKPPLDKKTGFGIVYGPETVIAPADHPVYIVDNGTANCTAPSAGCTEVGKPKYTQDQKKVESFASAYFINDPDQYEKILCDNDALFCEEFTSTKDGNFYFKNPVNKTCEFKSNVEISGQKFQGWFRIGTSDPCYDAYKINGDQYQIWKNGDAAYDGWVGSCPQEQDLCAEFIDIVDTEGGLKKDGTSYFFINNDKLIENESATSGACKGQVGQKNGCALFNNRSRSELNYNASVSYIVSTHSDVLLNKEPNALVDPVSCTAVEGGMYSVSEADKARFNLSDMDPDQNGTQIALCNSRCEYDIKSGNQILSNMSQFWYDDPKENKAGYLERSCLIDSDCPVLQTKDGEPATGFCSRDHLAVSFKLSNDSNTILKVNRDRSCSAWLACDSSRTSWNERTNKYEPICDSINLCVKGGQLGQTPVCADWSARDPEILTDYQYSKRDVNWNGYELSGFAIPNQLPVELYDQYNLNPEKVCKNKDGNVMLNSYDAPIACDSSILCAAGSCVSSSSDYRLVYNAGPCDSSVIANGGICQVGRCENTQSACALDKDCGYGNQCILGACQAVSTKACSKNSDCVGVFIKAVQPANVCDPISSLCVDKLTTGDEKETCGSQKSCQNTSASCIASSTTAIGACFNNRCLNNISDANGNGFADPIKLADALEGSCRGYPEVDSPYPASIVEQWMTSRGTQNDKKTGSDPSENATKEWSRPYTFKTGYQDSKVCATLSDGSVVDCVCSYDKLEYGKGVVTRYETVGEGDVPAGFCQNGPYEGHICESDTECTKKNKDEKGNEVGNETGTCLKLESQDTMLGWEGYCIEKDSSIQLYASTHPKDQACLTWLPVDQLSGATDLYAKYTSAGFAPQNAYYCAEVAIAYDFGSSLGHHCAEIPGGGNCDDEATMAAFYDDEAYEHTNCPPGFFAVMSPCGDAALDDGDDPLCEGGDDNYPYFCVPYLSYKTEDAEGKLTAKGEACAAPNKDLLIEGSFNGNGETILNNPNNGTRIYYMEKNNWGNAKAKYNDCKVRGIFSDDDTYTKYLGDGSVNGKVTIEAYDACRSLVQVARKSDPADNGDLNVAWTNRVWKDAKPPFIVNDYTALTPIEPFGIAQNLSAKLDQSQLVDPSPHRIYVCAKADSQIPVKGDGTCAEGYAPVGINDARSYYNVEMETLVGNFQKQWCQYNNCECNSEAKCNYDAGAPIECVEVTCTVNGQSCVNNSAFGQQATKAQGKCGGIANAAEKDSCFAEFAGEACKDAGGECKGVCQGGPIPGTSCVETSDCTVNACTYDFVSYKNKCAAKNGVNYNLNSESGGLDKVVANLKRLFAKAYGAIKFNNDGVYQAPGGGSLVSEFSDLSKAFSQEIAYQPDTNQIWQWDDVRKTGEVDSDQSAPVSAPVVVSLGECAGSQCREGNENAFTVNDQDHGDLSGTGSKRATVSFFAYANSNQMPIRRIVVDWGDGDEGVLPWPTNSQSGSTAKNNYYKNHRGLNAVGEEICGVKVEEFGQAPEACSSSFIAFSHDYVCSPGLVNTLNKKGRKCEYASDGRLFNSPCTDGTSCIYQPRVHVKDNWGWCAGFCNAGDDGTNGCFEGKPDDKNNECRINVCPSEGKSEACPDFENNLTVNPWVNYDGYVIIKP